MAVVHDNVVSNDVTITSSLRIGDNIRNKFFIFLVKWVIWMIRAKNYETGSTFVKVNYGLFSSGHGVYLSAKARLLVTLRYLATGKARHKTLDDIACSFYIHQCL